MVRLQNAVQLSNHGATKSRPIPRRVARSLGKKRSVLHIGRRRTGERYCPNAGPMRGRAPLRAKVADVVNGRGRSNDVRVYVQRSAPWSVRISQVSRGNATLREPQRQRSSASRYACRNAFRILAAAENSCFRPRPGLSAVPDLTFPLSIDVIAACESVDQTRHPTCLNHPRQSLAEIAPSPSEIASINVSQDSARRRRRIDSNFDHACSMGFRSGEYAGV
jgi:hypothetical protein